MQKIIIFIGGVAVGVFLGWAIWGYTNPGSTPENVVCLPADSTGNILFNDSLPQEYMAMPLDMATFHEARDHYRGEHPADEGASNGEWGGNIERNALYQALQHLGDNPFLEYYFCKDPSTLKTFVVFRSVQKQKGWNLRSSGLASGAGSEYSVVYNPTGAEMMIRTGASNDHFCPQRCD